MAQVNPLTAYVTAAAGTDASGVDLALLNAVDPTQDNALMEQTQNLALPYGEQIFAPVYNNNDIPAGESTAITDPYSEFVGPGVYIDPSLYSSPYAASLGVPAAVVPNLPLSLLLFLIGAVLLSGSDTNTNKHTRRS